MNTGIIPSSPAEHREKKPFSHVPEELKELPHWVVWKEIFRDGKSTKVPYSITGTPAKSNDKKTWSTFQEVVEHCQGYNGIGFMFTDDDPYIGIDLDGCRDPETGQVSEWAREITLRLGSYAEVSPSQTGVKIWCKGNWQFSSGKKTEVNEPSVCEKQPGIEVYQNLRYFTVTGQQLKGQSVIRECQNEINWLVKAYFALKTATRQQPTRQPGTPVVERARNYLAKLPGAVSGQRGHDATFHAACVLVQGFDLPEGDALALLHEYNDRCEPQWSEQELRHKIQSASEQPGERGYLLNGTNGNGNHTGRASGSSVPTDQPEEWPAPIPFSDALPPVAPFAADLLPAEWWDYVSDESERLQCPPDFIAVSLVTSFSALIGRQLTIRPKKKDNWSVVPNTFGAICARPSKKKSPAMKSGTVFLQRLEAEAAEQFKKDRLRQGIISIAAETAKKEQENEIKQRLQEGENPDDIAAAMQALNDPEEMICKARRYSTSDATPEKLVDLDHSNKAQGYHNAIAIICDELMALLKQMEKPGREDFRALVIKMWAGDQNHTMDRIGRGTQYIEGLASVIIGAIQPGPLTDYFRDNRNNGKGDDGLLNRFQLLVYPDPIKRKRMVDRWPNAKAKDRVWQHFRQFNNLDTNQVGAVIEEGELPYLRFSDGAQQLFYDWLESLEVFLESDDLPEIVESHFGKYRSLIPSLALLFHLVITGQGPVTKEALEMAIRWDEYLRGHAHRIYDSAINHEADAGRKLARRIQRGEIRDGFSIRDVYPKSWSGLTTRIVVEQAVDYLIDHNWLRGITIKTGGRPKEGFQINPAVLADHSSANGIEGPVEPEEPGNEWGTI